MPNTFTNKEYAGILYTVSAKEILRLRFWNTLTVTHIVQHMKPCTKFWSRLVPSHEKRQNMNNNGAERCVLHAVQWSPSMTIHRISKMTVQHRHRCVAFSTMMVPIHTTCIECNTFYRVSYTNHVRLCVATNSALTFCSWEAQFTTDGITNTRNSHCWAQENPHKVTQCHFQQRFSVHVWCGVLSNTFIAPHVIKWRLTAPSYRNFLENKLPLYIEDVPLAPWGQMWLWHDRAPPHFAKEVTEFLNEHSEGRWTGRNGPVTWPAWSPNLNPLDFFLWGCMKSRV